jgi:hypothetical protein
VGVPVTTVGGNGRLSAPGRDRDCCDARHLQLVGMLWSDGRVGAVADVAAVVGGVDCLLTDSTH